MSTVIGFVFYALVILFILCVGLAIFIDLNKNYISIRKKSKKIDTSSKSNFDRDLRLHK